jgi:hypothetical protein
MFCGKEKELLSCPSFSRYASIFSTVMLYDRSFEIRYLSFYPTLAGLISWCKFNPTYFDSSYWLKLLEAGLERP